jgi:hypothetical protein
MKTELSRFDKLYQDYKSREQKQLELNNQLDKETLKNCTFEPIINTKKYQNIRSQTPR